MKTLTAIVVGMTILGSAFAAEVRKDIEYGAHADTKLDASIPDGTGPNPILIIIHGGGWGSGDKRGDIVPEFGDRFDADFAWFTINYRLAPQNRWPACLEDVKTAIRWIKQHAAEFKGDPNRIALMGYSAGGQLAFLTALTAENDIQVQAAVGLSPPTDFEQDLPQRGGLSKSLQDLLDRPKEITDESRQMIRAMSPINHVKAGAPPFLIVQGTADKTVPLEQSRNFETKLKEMGISVDFIALPEAPHRIREWKNFDPQYQDKTVQWLKQKLSAPTTQPSERSR